MPGDTTESREPLTRIYVRASGGEDGGEWAVIEPFGHVIAALSHPAALASGWPEFKMVSGRKVAVNPHWVESVVPCG